MPPDERPLLHLTPVRGWLNDPNGMFLCGGRFHMTYQLHPDGPAWGRMHWGHATSEDLLAWHHVPPAISPDDTGTDSFGCWSGCIVQTPTDARLFYTGVSLDGELRRAVIRQATSDDPDRVHWRKHPGSVVDGAPSGVEPDLFRDPFVWQEDDGWRMIVGAGTTDGHGCVLLYDSPDLDTWIPRGPILSGDQVRHILGSDAPMWECPQLVRTAERDLLIVSVVDPAPSIRPSHVMAYVGRLIGDRFFVDRGERLGMGPDFYAPATVPAPDGRSLLFGWIPEDPPEPGMDRTWTGSLTLPRVVSLGADLRVSLALADEVLRARGPGERTGPHLLAPGGPDLVPRLPEGPFELAIELEPGPASELEVALMDDTGTDPLAVVSYRARDRQLGIARRGIIRVAGRSSMSAATLAPGDGPVVRIRILVDGSVLELEADGHTMGTVRLARHRAVDRRIRIVTRAEPLAIRELWVWPLRLPGTAEVRPTST